MTGIVYISDLLYSSSLIKSCWIHCCCNVAKLFFKDGVLVFSNARGVKIRSQISVTVLRDNDATTYSNICLLVINTSGGKLCLHQMFGSDGQMVRVWWQQLQPMAVHHLLQTWLLFRLHVQLTLWATNLGCTKNNSTCTKLYHNNNITTKESLRSRDYKMLCGHLN